MAYDTIIRLPFRATVYPRRLHNLYSSRTWDVGSGKSPNLTRQNATIWPELILKLHLCNTCILQDTPRRPCGFLPVSNRCHGNERKNSTNQSICRASAGFCPRWMKSAESSAYDGKDEAVMVMNTGSSVALNFSVSPRTWLTLPAVMNSAILRAFAQWRFV